jgi:hypothetical protein
MFAKMARGSYGRKGGYVDYVVSPGNFGRKPTKKLHEKARW